MKMPWLQVLLMTSACRVVPAETVCERQPELCDGSAQQDLDADGYTASVFGGDDCNDHDAAVNPAASELCDGIDADCDGVIDEEAADGILLYADADADGFGDPDTTQVRCEADADWLADASDCDDADADVNPGATEVCDTADVDEDCDELADDADDSVDTGTFSTFWVDGDGDGFGTDSSWSGCDLPSGYAVEPGDCDDADDAISPAATEVCDDGVDNDCDELADDLDDTLDTGTWSSFYGDGDGDGYGDDADVRHACTAPSGVATVGGDCDDADADVNPAATEVCDTGDVDEDCNGISDDADTGVDPGTQTSWHADDDGDGFGDAGTVITSCDAPSGYVADDQDCDDADTGISPAAAEVDCDGTDNDCDGRDGDVEVGLDASTLGDALALASSGDAVCVPAGTYSERITLVDGVSLIGVAGSANTTIDGSSGGVVVTADAVSGTVQGFTITGGSATRGAGLYATGPDLWLEDLDLTGNDCGDAGGSGTGLYLDGASVVVDVVVQDNTCEEGTAVPQPTESYGVGAYLVGALVEGLEVRDNASTSAMGYGTGLYLDGAEVTDLLVTGNQCVATDSCVGASVWASGASVRNAQIVDNVGTASTEHSGHVQLSDSSLLASIVAGNTCQSSDEVRGCAVALQDGGTLSNVAVVGNGATGQTLLGTGVYVAGDASAASELVNTVIAGNTASASTQAAGSALYVTGDTSTVSAHHSDFFDNGTGAFDGLTPDSTDGNLFVDPQFADTTAADAESWDLTLDTASPLIDAGDTGLLDEDGSRSDIGAYGGPNGDW